MVFWRWSSNHKWFGTNLQTCFGFFSFVSVRQSLKRLRMRFDLFFLFPFLLLLFLFCSDEKASRQVVRRSAEHKFSSTLCSRQQNTTSIFHFLLYSCIAYFWNFSLLIFLFFLPLFLFPSQPYLYFSFFSFLFFLPTLYSLLFLLIPLFLLFLFPFQQEVVLIFLFLFLLLF